MKGLLCLNAKKPAPAGGTGFFRKGLYSVEGVNTSAYFAHYAADGL